MLRLEEGRFSSDAPFGLASEGPCFSSSSVCAAEASGAPSDAAPHGGLVQPARLRRLLPRVATSYIYQYIITATLHTIPTSGYSTIIRSGCSCYSVLSCQCMRVLNVHIEPFLLSTPCACCVWQSSADASGDATCGSSGGRGPVSAPHFLAQPARILRPRLAHGPVGSPPAQRVNIVYSTLCGITTW